MKNKVLLLLPDKDIYYFKNVLSDVIEIQSVFKSKINEHSIFLNFFRKTNIDAIREFFEKPFIPYDFKYKKYYSIEEWVKRFK